LSGPDANDMGDIVFDHSEHFGGDSSLSLRQPFNQKILKVYQRGELTIVGFGGCDVPDNICIADYRDYLNQMVNEYRCKILKIDLSGVKLIPAGMLGLLTSLRKKVERIVLCNPSTDIREALHVTYLEKRFEIEDAFEFHDGHETSN